MQKALLLDLIKTNGKENILRNLLFGGYAVNYFRNKNYNYGKRKIGSFQ